MASLVNPYLTRLRIWIWVDLGCFAAFVGIFSLGDPLGLAGVNHPALPLLFFLASVTGLGVLMTTLVVVLFGLLATFWRPPVDPGTGLTP